MKRIMAVISGEKLFAERFCEFVNNNSHIIYTAIPFSDLETLNNYRKEHEIPIMLCDKELLRDQLLTGSLDGVRTVPLSGNKKESEEEKSIYKYQSAGQIVRELMDCLSDMKFTGGMSFTGRPVFVTGVYSPGACGMKTSFALSLASHLRKKGKVLYINFEEFTGLGSVTGEECDRGLSNMLYYLKQGMLTGQRILSMVYSFAGFDYIPPIQFADDYSAITGEECAHLIRTVFAETLYDIVVADLPETMRVSSEIMDICETVYVPVTPGREQNGKLRDFDNYLALSGREKLIHKIRKVTLPENAGGDITDLSGGEYIEKLIYGPFSDILGDDSCG